MTDEDTPGGGSEVDRPSLREFVERSARRLLLEATLGAAAGALLSTVLPRGEGRAFEFALVGAVAAPVALLLTPVLGSVKYRAVRYGLALSVILTLFLSFMAGGEGVLLEELLVFATLIFGIGALGHGVMLASLER